MNTLIEVAESVYDSKYGEEITDKCNVITLCHFVPYLIEMKKQRSRLSIIDVGCADCTFLLFFKYFFGKEVEKLAGVNLFPLPDEVFAESKKVDELFGDGPGKIDYIELDIDKEPLPLPNHSFDAVLLTDVLEHLYDPSFAFQEISRVLAPGGLLLLKTVNCATLRNRVRVLVGKSPYHDFRRWLYYDRLYVPRTGERKFQGHIREYTKEELQQLLNDFGFTPVDVRLYPASRYRRRTLLKIYNLIEALYPNYAYTISIVAVKDQTPNNIDGM